MSEQSPTRAELLSLLQELFNDSIGSGTPAKVTHYGIYASWVKRARSAIDAARPKECKSNSPDFRCVDCNCWKATRAACS